MSTSAALLMLALLATPPAPSKPAFPPDCALGVRHLALSADASSNAPVVCIRPGLTTNLLFDSTLASVELEKRERFSRVKWEGDTLTLLPSTTLPDGEHLLLTVRFQEEEAPTSATFVLMVHPSQAERQVEVSRHPRSMSSYQQEAQQARVEARLCQEEKRQFQTQCGGPVGLMGMLLHGLMNAGGIPALDLTEVLVPRPGDTLFLRQAHSYASTLKAPEGTQQVLRLAVDLWLENLGTEPWRVAGAALVGPHGEALRGLTVRQLEPIMPGKGGGVAMEVEAPAQEAEGPFTLKLWTARGLAGSVMLDGVTFP